MEKEMLCVTANCRYHHRTERAITPWSEKQGKTFRVPITLQVNACGMVLSSCQSVCAEPLAFHRNKKKQSLDLSTKWQWRTLLIEWDVERQARRRFETDILLQRGLEWDFSEWQAAAAVATGNLLKIMWRQIIHPWTVGLLRLPHPVPRHASDDNVLVLAACKPFIFKLEIAVRTSSTAFPTFETHSSDTKLKFSDTAVDMKGNVRNYIIIRFMA